MKSPINISSLNDEDPLLTRGILNRSRSREVRAMFESLLSRRFRFGLCHGDIALWNAWLDKEGIVHLLDWGCARSEIVPHYQINEILRASKPGLMELAAYLDGYGMSKTEYMQIRTDLHVLSILREMDTLRWAIDKMPSQIDAITINLMEALKGRNLVSFS